MDYHIVVIAARDFRTAPNLAELLSVEDIRELDAILHRASVDEVGAGMLILGLLTKDEARRLLLLSLMDKAASNAHKEKMGSVAIFESTRGSVMRGPAGVASSMETSKGKFARVKIFYATDRLATGKIEPARFFTGERSEGEAMTYGTCEVSIPADHKKGELEAPSILRLEFRQDPVKHVVLLDVAVRPRDEFFRDVAEMVKGSPGKEAFVFVHGYNVSFEDAARRTAQFSFDLPFKGAPILYSWPSRGRTMHYKHDENNVEWSTPHLRQFLLDTAAGTGAEVIHLIAHSMGNRAMTRALESLDPGSAAFAKFHQIVLTAPDIDAAVFKQLAPKLVSAGKRVTLYASSNDLALLASRKFNGYRRAGDSGGDLVILPSIDTIDASAVDTSLMGHSYFGENRTVLSDFYYLLRGDRPAERADLRQASCVTGEYWEFRP